MARRKETTIERIYREVTGRKMSKAIKRILLRRRNAKPKTGWIPTLNTLSTVWTSLRAYRYKFNVGSFGVFAMKGTKCRSASLSWTTLRSYAE